MTCSTDKSKLSDESDEEKEETFFLPLTNINNYILIEKLGEGTFAEVWLCYDKEKKIFVACKFQKSTSDNDSFKEEFELMKKIGNTITVDAICLDTYFTSDGEIINSLTEDAKETNFIVMELAGVTLENLMNVSSHKFDGNIERVKTVMRQILELVAKLHDQKIVHTDLKPENILCDINYEYINNLKNIDEKDLDIVNIVAISDSCDKKKIEKKKNISKIKLSDFGNSLSFDELGYEIQTKNYRAPEIILEYKVNEKCDIWSLGCLMYEMITGEILFSGKKTKKYSSNVDYLAQMIKKLGVMPEIMIEKSAKGKVMFSNEKILNIKKKLYYEPLYVDIYEAINKNKKKSSSHDVIYLLDVLYKMLDMNPDKRLSAKECLSHNFFS